MAGLHADRVAGEGARPAKKGRQTRPLVQQPLPQRIPHQLRGIAHADLVEHARTVVLRGLGADVERARDLLGGLALGDQVEHLALARGEPAVGVVHLALGMAQLLGQEVAMLEADTVYGIITTNGNLADGYALFSTEHGNSASAPAAISTDAIGIMRVMMMRQTSPGGKPIATQPRYLLAPATKAQLAEQYTSVNFVAATPSAINPMAGRLTPIPEPRLDADSTTNWYLFADPNSPNGAVLISTSMASRSKFAMISGLLR